MSFKELSLRKDPNCDICGLHRKITTLIDYPEFCGIHIDDTISEISVEELNLIKKENLPHQIIDVRNPNEWAISKVLGSHLISLTDLEKTDFLQFNKKLLTVVLCKSGVRSRQAIPVLKTNGFENLKNLNGGINEWARKVDRRLNIY